MKREEYEAAISAAQVDLVEWCKRANFIEIDNHIQLSAHYLIELSKRWDYDRDQARHMAHGRKGNRVSIEKAVSEAEKATKRYFRDKVFEDLSRKYGLTDPEESEASSGPQALALDAEPYSHSEHPEDPSLPPETSVDPQRSEAGRGDPSPSPEKRDRARARKEPGAGLRPREDSKTSPPPKSGRSSGRKAPPAQSRKPPPESPPRPAPEASQPPRTQPSKETEKPQPALPSLDPEPSAPSQDSSKPSQSNQ